jgi:hypothetical protein
MKLVKKTKETRTHKKTIMICRCCLVSKKKENTNEKLLPKQIAKKTQARTKLLAERTMDE